jgi:hypothetical protein
MVSLRSINLQKSQHLGQIVLCAILMTDRTYACTVFPWYPVISATREKNAFLNPELIVQFTGGV